jgi:hypothetical protein
LASLMKAANPQASRAKMGIAGRRAIVGVSAAPTLASTQQSFRPLTYARVACGKLAALA